MLEDTLINKKERQEKLALVVQMAVAKGDTEFMFENEKYIKSVAIDDKNNTYYVSVVNGVVDEKLLPVTEIIK